MPLLTPENLPAVLTAVAAIIAAAGGITWWKSRGEPPKPGTPDAATIALAENTKAVRELVDSMKSQNTHFADNNEMFRATGHQLAGLARDIADIRHATATSEGHLGAIRDASNRRAP